MNRDHIDFTKTGKCCLCGEEKQLSEAEIGRFGKYTACRTLICPDCVKLCGAKPGEDGRLFVKNVDGVPAKVAAMSSSFATAAKKALTAEWKKRGDLKRWIIEPFAVVGEQTHDPDAFAHGCNYSKEEKTKLACRCLEMAKYVNLM